MRSAILFFIKIKTVFHLISHSFTINIFYILFIIFYHIYFFNTKTIFFYNIHTKSFCKKKNLILRSFTTSTPGLIFITALKIWWSRFPFLQFCVTGPTNVDFTTLVFRESPFSGSFRLGERAPWSQGCVVLLKKKVFVIVNCKVKIKQSQLNPDNSNSLRNWEKIVRVIKSFSYQKIEFSKDRTCSLLGWIFGQKMHDFSMLFF